MKKIINGKKYDTTTATKIASQTLYYNGNNVSGWNTIYRKKSGEFFLEHQTSGMNCWDLKEYILPLSELEAREMCEELLDGEEYESVFGEVEE